MNSLGGNGVPASTRRGFRSSTSFPSTFKRRGTACMREEEEIHRHTSPNRPLLNLSGRVHRRVSVALLPFLPASSRFNVSISSSLLLPLPPNHLLPPIRLLRSSPARRRPEIESDLFEDRIVRGRGGRKVEELNLRGVRSGRGRTSRSVDSKGEDAGEGIVGGRRRR